jgi:hypothetical protein
MDWRGPREPILGVSDGTSIARYSGKVACQFWEQIYGFIQGMALIDPLDLAILTIIFFRLWHSSRHSSWLRI